MIQLHSSICLEDVSLSMKVSYQHANPDKGNESFLIRVTHEYEQRTSCVLVDAGDGVDLDKLLGEDEDLVAILLTHAHLDHYQSLDDAHRDAAPIYTTPGTAAMLGDVLAEGEQHFGLKGTDQLLERVKPIDDRVDLLGGELRFRPVPVGHAPGAGGFLIEVADDDETVRMLATGDFTRRDAAGYPGFDPNAFADVDVLFLTAATTDGMDEQLTELVGMVAERTNAGSRTLVTASGLTGVHLATLFATVDDELNYSLPTILVGQVAKLYDALGYDYPKVESIPEFSDPVECLEHGVVTIAGPEVPTEGSSQRLFETLQNDGNASLIQVQGGSTNAKEGGDFAGTVTSFSFSNHPTEAVLNEVVETISPIHVVVEHQRRNGLRTYKDKWDSFTWANWDDDEEVLYRDGAFVPPSWVGNAVERRVRSRDGQSNTIQVGDDVLKAVSSYPTLDRRGTISLEAEGVDIEALRQRLRVKPTPATPTVSTATTTGDNVQDETRSIADGGLYQTVGRDLPQVNYVSISKTETTRPSGLVDTVRPTTPTSRCDHDESASEPTAESNGTTSESEQTTTERDDETMSQSEQPEGATDVEQADGEPTTGTGDFTFEIDPAIRALTEQRVTAESGSVDDVVYDAVEKYLAEIVRGREPWTDGEGLIERQFDVEADAAFEQLLTAGAESTGAPDIESFVLQRICSALEFDQTDRALSVESVEPLAGLMDAAVENDGCPHGTRNELMQAALEAEIL